MTSNKNTQIANLIYSWEVISITCCYFCTGYFGRLGSHTYSTRLFQINNHINSIKFFFSQANCNIDAKGAINNISSAYRITVVPKITIDKFADIVYINSK